MNSLRFGVNYVPSTGWWYSWLDWNDDALVADLDAIAGLGCDHIRIHCLWPLFQPNPRMVSSTMLDRLERLLEVADTAGLDVIVTVFNGWLSGFDFRPDWLSADANIFADAEVIGAQLRLLDAIGGRIGTHTRFLGFDIANEPSVIAGGLGREAGERNVVDLGQGDAWVIRLLEHCQTLAPAGMHSVGMDHKPWLLSDEPFSRTTLARTGQVTPVHAWIYFTGALERYGAGGTGTVHLAEFMLELAKAFDESPDRLVWLQEYGASTEWLDDPADFLEASTLAAASVDRLWGLTWWCSHDISRDLGGFVDLEYDLGLLTVDNELKPAGRRMREVIRRVRAGEARMGVRQTALVLEAGRTPDLDFADEFFALIDQGIRPAIVLSDKATDERYLAERNIRRLVQPSRPFTQGTAAAMGTLTETAEQSVVEIKDRPNPWNDPELVVNERVETLISAMTLREKLAQLYGIWVGASAEGGDVAPFQHENEEVVDLDELVIHGLGQLTRPFGSDPIDPAVGALSLARTQAKIVSSSRFGIPAIAHEECLSGFTTWGATCYPVPLAWGATFEPALIERMAARIGRSMRAVGVHQGLAPVLDVTRDYRWGRVEETIGEDPYLVAVTATAYVRGLQEAGVIATLKHFVGYSASRSGRNLAPVSIGSREFADILEPPFEMAVRDGNARSVMNSYTDIDGVPVAADEALLTVLLRDRWGFEGTVVADYGAVTFLRTAHHVAQTDGQAAALALRAGIDVELPTVSAYGDPLLEEIGERRISEAYVDRALRRVLAQKVELGLLDPDWSALPDGFSGNEGPDEVRGRVDLDLPEDRQLARVIAERSIVLLSNDGTLPVQGSPRRIAVIGPSAGDPMVLVGCYAFPNHVLDRHPGVELGIDMPTLVDAVRAEYVDAEVVLHAGVTISGDDESGIPEAVALAEAADLVIVAVGDRAGLFGRGTSGEGCDVDSIELPGRQWQLLDAVLDVDSPVVVALIVGRPYVLHDAPERAAAIMEAFFPGEEGAGAISGVISGRVNPSGRLPVRIPRNPGTQPDTYLAPSLALSSSVSSVDPSARFPFGHGLSYSTFSWSTPAVSATSIPVDGEVEISLEVTNTSARDGVEVVQVYLHDPVASVVRPIVRLIGFTTVTLAGGSSARVSFQISADLTAFTGAAGNRIVEPGEIELRLSRSSEEVLHIVPLTITGTVRTVDHTRELTAVVTVET